MIFAKLELGPPSVSRGPIFYIKRNWRPRAGGSPGVIILFQSQLIDDIAGGIVVTILADQITDELNVTQAAT